MPQSAWLQTKPINRMAIPRPCEDDLCAKAPCEKYLVTNEDNDGVNCTVNHVRGIRRNACSSSIPTTSPPFRLKIPIYNSSPSAQYPRGPRHILAVPTYSSPRLALTFPLHFLLKPFSSSLHILAASTFAGLSSFGSLSMLITLRSIVSGVCTGDQRSEADSYPYLSSSGG